MTVDGWWLVGTASRMDKNTTREGGMGTFVKVSYVYQKLLKVENPRAITAGMKTTHGL